MAVNEWIGFRAGIRYYTHPERKRTKYSKEPDRMWGFQFKFRGKVHVANLGWESEGKRSRAMKTLYLCLDRNLLRLENHHILAES